jgi:diguanylate cyclase (GGDEF)-like protein
MRCLLFFLIAQCFLVNTVVASTQGSYRSEQWEVANSDTIENGQRVVTIGLPQISVKAMVQDKSGLMWIGTENGLARFDGRHFEIFNTINAPNLPSNWVTQLYSDDNEKVWVLTADGVAIFDGNTFSPLTGNKNTYTSIAQTRNGDIWLAGNGLWHYHDGSLSKARFATDDVISVNAHGDNLWLLERTNQLVRVNLQAEQSGSQQCRFQLPDDIRIENTVVTASQVFFVASNRLYALQYANDNCQLRYATHNVTQDIQRLSHANSNRILALDTNGRLFRVTQSPEIALVPLDITLPDNITRDDPRLYSSGDVIWLGTKTQGLISYWSTPIKRENTNSALANARVWSFFVSDTVYAATDLGIFKKSESGEWRDYISPAFIEGEEAYSFLIKDDTHYVGTRNGLYISRNNAMAFLPQKGVDNVQINSLVDDADGVYIASNNGLFTIDPERQVTRIPYFANQAVRSVYRAVDNTLWVGTESGLYYNDGTVWQESMLPTPNRPFVSSITEDDEKGVYVATYGAGLFYKPDSGAWVQYSGINGLPFQSLFSVNVAEEQVWLSSASGIFTLDLSALKDNEINRVMLLRDDGTFVSRDALRCCNGAGNRRGVVFDERVYFPTLQGVLSLPLQVYQITSPAVVITGTFQNGIRIQQDSAIQLEDKNRHIEIGFTQPIFGSEDIAKYRYRLTDSANEWIYAGERNVAYFTNLPPGESTFEVQATFDGIHWGSPAHLIINADGFWWEQWWAKVILIGLAILLLYGLVLLRTKALEAQNARLEHIVKDRTSAYENVNRQLEEKNVVLKHAANTDLLTGLNNRRVIKEFLPGLLELINRRLDKGNQHDVVCAIFLLDLDNFKRINDSFGHDKGDEVLISAANAIKHVSRADDCLLRWGGEEFLFIVPSILMSDITTLNKRIHGALANIHISLELPTPITFSAGATYIPWGEGAVDITTWQRSLLLVDWALYKVKNTGRNNTYFVEPTVSLNHWLHWSQDGIDKAEHEALLSVKPLL